jgi:endonuclease/exonuclease/phosphatase (EEP) superfamily protein YafD
LKRFFNKSLVSYTVLVLIGTGVVLSMAPLDLPVFQRWTNYTVSLIFIYLLLGLFFLVISNTRLLLASFLAAGILSFFLKVFSSETMSSPETVQENSFTVSNFNLINLKGDIYSFLGDMQHTGSDILCFHEVNPGWARILTRALSAKYPYQASLVRIDAFGKMVLSNMPFERVDTFYFDSIPGMDLRLNLEGSQSRLIVTQIVPPFRGYRGLSSNDQLFELAGYINRIDVPVLLAGEFNQVYWSRELRNMVEQTRLLNSRRFITTLGSKVPHEHIFHSGDFECTRVMELQDEANAHIGVEASFRLENTPSIPDDFFSMTAEMAK